MTKLLTSPWTSAPLGAVLYLASMLLFWKTPVPPALDRGHAAAAVHGPSWDFTNPELDQLITELKSEKGAVALRQQQLDELAARLNAERQEVAAAKPVVIELAQKFFGFHFYQLPPAPPPPKLPPPPEKPAPPDHPPPEEPPEPQIIGQPPQLVWCTIRPLRE